MVVAVDRVYHGHLGSDLGRMNMLLLKKIEAGFARDITTDRD
jgi:hypothetical protein